MEQGRGPPVKRNALAGAPSGTWGHESAPAGWCLETTGRRVHGTTKQLPWRCSSSRAGGAAVVPALRWEPAEWKRATLHPDCHVVFANAYSSAPHRLMGQRLWVRGTPTKVEVFQDHRLVATHPRGRPGQRQTLTAHLPPDKLQFLLQTPVWCRERAAEIGPACAAFVEALLGERPLDRLRGAQGVLRLAQRFGAPRLEAACTRAHAVGEYRYHTIKTILAQALDQQPLPAAFTPPVAPAVPPRHVRPWTTFFPDPGHEDRRSASWN